MPVDPTATGVKPVPVGGFRDRPGVKMAVLRRSREPPPNRVTNPPATTLYRM